MPSIVTRQSKRNKAAWLYTEVRDHINGSENERRMCQLEHPLDNANTIIFADIVEYSFSFSQTVYVAMWVTA